MSSITNTTISSYDFLLRQCYSTNRNARKPFARSTMEAHDLVNADSTAIKRAARNLKEMEYSTDNGMNIYNNIKAFVESYNNLFDSSDKIKSSDELTRAEKKLKNYIKDNKDALEELGIKVSSNGKLTVDKETLLTTTASKIGKFFSEKNDFTDKVSQLATKISRIAKNMLRSGNSQTKKATGDTADSTASLLGQPTKIFSNTIDYKA